jgi:hypothetical protein
MPLEGISASVDGQVRKSHRSTVCSRPKHSFILRSWEEAKVITSDKESLKLITCTISCSEIEVPKRRECATPVVARCHGQGGEMSLSARVRWTDCVEHCKAPHFPWSSGDKFLHVILVMYAEKVLCVYVVWLCGCVVNHVMRYALCSVPMWEIGACPFVVRHGRVTEV